MGGVIESNIPEGTLWPDLDDGPRMRQAQLIETIIEYGKQSRPFDELRRFAHLDSPVWSASAQWDSYIALKIAEDKKR